MRPKWKGGERVAKIEALEKLIFPVINDVKELGIDINDIDLTSDVFIMRQKLENICSASSVKEFSQKN
jgi:hypothetical protein